MIAKILPILLGLTVAGCLAEAPLPNPGGCTLGTAGCPCQTDNQCHSGSALGYGEYGWTCQKGLCVAFECKSKYDCHCPNYATGSCNGGFCQCP